MHKLRENAIELLNLHNYFDDAIIFDENAVAVYYDNSRSGGSLHEEAILGKHISQIYPELDLDKSVVLKAVREGLSTYNLQESVKLYDGREISHMITVLPIFEEGNITGAVEVSMNTSFNARRNIYITPEFGRKNQRLYRLDDIISGCAAMDRVKEKIRKVARTDSPVLIYGKTGTGKEMVAESIHTEGKRRDKPFISQNCAAIPANLLESMLFGTTRGSFTGAEDRAGLLEKADRGTLFLDEINNMDIALQAKILKAIEEQKVTRVGDFQPRNINVRIIAAANEDPLELVKKLALRQDLYYRLRVVQINLPELSQRKGDIPLLTEYFINKYNRIMHRNIAGADDEMMKMLCRRQWLGNIRELENTIECAFNFAEGTYLTVEDIPWLEKSCHGDKACRQEGKCQGGKNCSECGDAVSFGDFSLESGKSLKTMMREYEYKLISDAIEKNGDLKSVAASLGITRQNLNHKLKQYQLENKFYMDKKF